MNESNPKKRDYYSILGAEENATQSEIERLYKRRAVKHHPDRGGDEEEMKSLNEAYRVLKDATARRAYDAGRRNSRPKASTTSPPPYSSPSAQADPIMGRFAGAALCLFAGLFLLLLVRFQWIWFLWPLGILAVAVLLFGVLMARTAMVAMRESFKPTHPARRFTKLQDALFWSAVCACGYGLYLILTEV